MPFLLFMICEMSIELFYICCRNKIIEENVPMKMYMKFEVPLRPQFLSHWKVLCSSQTTMSILSRNTITPKIAAMCNKLSFLIYTLISPSRFQVNPHLKFLPCTLITPLNTESHIEPRTLVASHSEKIKQ